MKTVTIRELKMHLSKLVDGASKGESFVIERAGKPIVMVIGLSTPTRTKTKRLGFMSRQILVPDDFDRIAEVEIKRTFCGRK